MLRLTGNHLLRRSRYPTKQSLTSSTLLRTKSTSSPLQGDSGNVATHIHHKITTFLAVATPLYIFSPDAIVTDSADKLIGSLLAINISAHSWIGLNYVITDYVPKVSKGLLGPARIFTAGLSLVTLLGLGKVAMNEKGGIRGTVLGLWRGPKSGKKE